MNMDITDILQREPRTRYYTLFIVFFSFHSPHPSLSLFLFLCLPTASLQPYNIHKFARIK